MPRLCHFTNQKVNVTGGVKGEFMAERTTFNIGTGETKVDKNFQPQDLHEAVTYPEYPDYMKAVVESCENCVHLMKSDDSFYCTNVDTNHYLEGGMLFTPILKPAEWHCPLWKEKAEG